MQSQIKTIYGDLLTERPNSVIIHGCNCQNLMLVPKFQLTCRKLVV